MKRTISIVTTCKGRLEHLKQTLPHMLSQKFHEVIVVDFDCPQGTAHWVASNQPEVHVIHITGRPCFNLSEARNAGAAAATGELLFFVDADIILKSGLSAFIQKNGNTNTYLTVDVPSNSPKARSERQ